MRIGVPKEIKIKEFRVGLVPGSVAELVNSGHDVYIETNAGANIGIDDREYIQAGATILKRSEDIFDVSEMIVKVKEPQWEEIDKLKPGQIVFTYLHLAADREKTMHLLNSGVSCVAYETVTDTAGLLPLLAPMSAIAGRMSVQVGAHFLEKNNGGKGILLSGVPGIEPANVVILGAGVAGSNALKIAVGMGAQVTVIDKNLEKLNLLDSLYGSRIKTVYSTRKNITTAVESADLLIGAVLIPGAVAPKLVTEDIVKSMTPKSVIVDIAIDQGGCIETSLPTNHSKPTYYTHDVLHYCVTNMPGSVAKTATYALNNATLPYIKILADNGLERTMWNHDGLRNGLNIWSQNVVNQEVATAFGLPWAPAFIDRHASK